MTGPEPDLSHLDPEGAARMVDVGGKAVTARTARAACRVALSPETARRALDGDLPKGDLTAVARLAGIQAAKRTADLLPLCHPLRLTAVDVEVTIDPDAGAVDVTSAVRAEDRTGVEMEALTAAAVAALAVYDMVKAVQRDARIEELRLLEKTGGARGDWHAPDQTG